MKEERQHWWSPPKIDGVVHQMTGRIYLLQMKCTATGTFEQMMNGCLARLFGPCTLFLVRSVVKFTFEVLSKYSSKTLFSDVRLLTVLHSFYSFLNDSFHQQLQIFEYFKVKMHQLSDSSSCQASLEILTLIGTRTNPHVHETSWSEWTLVTWSTRRTKKRHANYMDIYVTTNLQKVWKKDPQRIAF